MALLPGGMLNRDPRRPVTADFNSAVPHHVTQPQRSLVGSRPPSGRCGSRPTSGHAVGSRPQSSNPPTTVTSAQQKSRSEQPSGGSRPKTGDRPWTGASRHAALKGDAESVLRELKAPPKIPLPTGILCYKDYSAISKSPKKRRRPQEDLRQEILRFAEDEIVSDVCDLWEDNKDLAEVRSRTASMRKRTLELMERAEAAELQYREEFINTPSAPPTAAYTATPRATDAVLLASAQQQAQDNDQPTYASWDANPISEVTQNLFSNTFAPGLAPKMPQQLAGTGRPESAPQAPASPAAPLDGIKKFKQRPAPLTHKHAFDCEDLLLETSQEVSPKPSPVKRRPSLQEPPCSSAKSVARKKTDKQLDPTTPKDKREAKQPGSPKSVGKKFDSNGGEKELPQPRQPSLVKQKTAPTASRFSNFQRRESKSGGLSDKLDSPQCKSGPKSGETKMHEMSIKYMDHGRRQLATLHIYEHSLTNDMRLMVHTIARNEHLELLVEADHVQDLLEHAAHLAEVDAEASHLHGHEHQDLSPMNLIGKVVDVVHDPSHTPDMYLRITGWTDPTTRRQQEQSKIAKDFGNVFASFGKSTNSANLFD